MKTLVILITTAVCFISCKQHRVSQGGNRIRVYDLNGKPIREYLLDHYINGIHVDEKKRIILAVDANDDEPIIKYIMEK